MVQKELNQKIQETAHPLWFKDVEVKFEFDHLDISIIKEGFLDIYQYVSRQERGWAKIEGHLPQEFQMSKNKIEQLLKNLNLFINGAENWNISQLNSQWAILVNQIKALNSHQVLITDSPATTFLIDIFRNHGTNHFNGAYNYLLNHSKNVSFTSPEQLTGAFMGYEYKFQESTKITKRRGQEKSANSRLRNNFEKHFTETNNNLVEHFTSTNETVKKYSEFFQKELAEKKNNFEEWFSQTKEEYSTFNEASVKSMSDNEELYKEKLKLEAPATYWRDRAQKLRKEGNNWLTGLLISSGVGVIALGVVLFLISDGTLKELFDGTGSAIRWSIVFITFVSFLAYGIRTFAKLTFSSFHLVRDAEEREQLAYVYLALKKEKNIDDTERHLVMQSIFSRADSGLLKDDTSPTMPGNIVDKFIAKN